MDLMTARRRLFMDNVIGYTAGLAWVYNSRPPVIEENESFFITGFIPYAPAEYGYVQYDLTFKYSSGDYYRSSQHTVVFYGADKEPLGPTSYYDMTQRSGVRQVRGTVDIINVAKYIRFCGYLPSIDTCYVYDNNSKVYLWKKGM